MDEQTNEGYAGAEPSKDLTSEFRAMFNRVRLGDAAAAEELVRRFEADLRIIARARLFDPRLRQLMDSVDICQSIFGQFFFRAYAGQFDFESPEQLLKLLAAMVRNKVTDYARHYTSEKRDVGRVVEMDSQWHVDNQPSILSQIAARDLIEVCRQKMTADERVILDGRMQDQSWQQIAESVQAAPDAVRKKFMRALDRVSSELGIDSNC